MLLFFLLLTLSLCIPSPLNVHLVPHTHNDVGWKKTVDQYYVGLNNTIQEAGVQYILDSVVLALMQNSQRKFIYVEMAFFARWWKEQDEKMKSNVRMLIENGQLEFTNAGWCMNDEAVTSYTDIIEQMTRGHAFIRREFGEAFLPTVAWQIDPFGHSAEHATLLAQMGFDAVFFARIDYQEKTLRIANSTLEYIWRSSPTFGSAVDLFTGVFYDHYGAPQSFNFEINGDPIQDDLRLNDINIHQRVSDFAAYCHMLAANTVGNAIMLTMGDDFAYQNANVWFKNLDKLINYLNEHVDEFGINAFYSTPRQYVHAKHELQKMWTVKFDDNFPYCSSYFACWTGYFTSRPTFKGYVADLSNTVRVCNQMEVLQRVFFNEHSNSTEALAEALSLAQHHDAITGTEKQHVANDYSQRLSKGESVCQVLIANATSSLLFAGKLSVCGLLNESVCSSSSWSGSDRLSIVVYNSLAWNVEHIVNLPINFLAFVVMDQNYQRVNAQISKLTDIDLHVQQLAVSGELANFSVSFLAHIPPLGYAEFYLVPTPSNDPLHFKQSAEVEVEDSFLENDVLRLDISNGLITNIFNKNDFTNISLTQGWFWYHGMNGSKELHQSGSGAYVFRPFVQFPFALNVTSFLLTRGIVFDELVTVFDNYIQQRLIVYHSNTEPFFNLEYTVGPIPVDDFIGKEIILRFNTSVLSNGTLFTDSNGRSMRIRQLNHRPSWNLNVTEPVSQNYYPLSSAYIEDNNSRFAVVSERFHGGSSLGDGELEIMLHRRLVTDDRLGVAESLNELGSDGKGLITRGNFRIIVAVPSASAQVFKTQTILLRQKPVVMVGSQVFKKQFQFLRAPFPSNLHMQTLNALENNAYLLRIAHLYEKNEDPALSLAVKFDLDAFMLPIKRLVEVSLTGNSTIRERLQWSTYPKQMEFVPKEDVNGGLILIQPMEIRTFEIEFF